MEFSLKDNDDVGELHLVVGPMYSGKSSQLIKKYEDLVNDESGLGEEEVLVVTHSLEKRYSSEKLSSHDRKEIACKKFSSIQSIIESCDSELENVRYLLIDESQFFHDLLRVLTLVESHNKKVYAYGLDGDFKRNKFGSITDLIPFCDSVQKLRGICGECFRPSLFSRRITNDLETQIVVGSEDKYVPLCRSCYLDRTERDDARETS